MALTTIQVDVEVRDRLKAIADASHTSIKQVVARMAADTLTPAELTERQVRGRAAMAATGVVLDDDPADPDRRAAEAFWTGLEGPAS
jgi:predicted transcriptional regulator